MDLEVLMYYAVVSILEANSKSAAEVVSSISFGSVGGS